MSKVILLDCYLNQGKQNSIITILDSDGEDDNKIPVRSLEK